VRRSKSAAVKRKSGTAVSAPNTTLGRRRAASSETRASVSADWFHHRAAATEAKMSDFITIGCSAFGVMSPRS
jgi:hypothetical protein